MPLRHAAVALIAALALTGCSGDDPPDPPATPSSSGTPTAPSSSATPSAKPTEPVLPEAATKATEAGARAFITYYFDLIGYAQESGDVRALRRASASSCVGCASGVDGVRQHYRDGGRLVGGQLTATIDRIGVLSTKSRNLYGFRAAVTTTHTSQRVVQSNGSEDIRPAGTEKWELYLLWTPDNRWRLDVMTLL